MIDLLHFLLWVYSPRARGLFHFCNRAIKWAKDHPMREYPEG